MLIESGQYFWNGRKKNVAEINRTEGVDYKKIRRETRKLQRLI